TGYFLVGSTRSEPRSDTIGHHICALVLYGALPHDGYTHVPASCPEDLRRWLLDPRLECFPNNETRAHMLSDLGRYFFATLYGDVVGVSPKAREFPPEL